MNAQDRPGRRHWTELVLHFADGSGLTSTWQPEVAAAAQSGGRQRMGERAATAEHLRALAELREAGGCTNWYTSAELEPLEAQQLQNIDWTGFEYPALEL